MELATGLLIGGFAVAITASLVAIQRLLAESSGHIRNICVTFLLVIVMMDLCYIVSISMPGTPAGSAGVILSGILQFAGSAVLMHLSTAFQGNVWPAPWRRFMAVVYSPVMLVISLAAIFFVIDPSSFVVTWDGGISDVVFGAAQPALLVLGAFYMLVVVQKLSWLILRGDRSIRIEVALVLGMSTLSLLVYFLPTRLAPGLSSWSVSLLSSSMVALVLAYAALKKSLLVVPRKETGAAAADVRVGFAPGTTHLYLRTDREKARSTFAYYAKGGKEGLWVTRRNPSEARQKYGLVHTPFVWLTGTDIAGEVCIDPADTGKLSKAFTGFIGAAGEYIILFEGLEYLLSVNGFKSTLNLMQFLNDKVMGSRGALLVSLDPAALNGTELAMLKSEAAEVQEDAPVARHPDATGHGAAGAGRK